MKIQFEDETTSLPLTDDLVSENIASDDANPETLEKLNEGIEAAQTGDRVEARQILLKVTEEDPKNEAAWLWLASISEYPEELLIFLNNVLGINPENERALKWAAETKTLLSKTFVQRGIDAEGEGNKEFAKQCFLQAIVHDAESELAWMWLASVADSDEEKISHLTKALTLDPDNQKAAESLRRARRRVAQSAFADAKTAYFDGDLAKSNKLADKCLEIDHEFEEALFLKSELSGTIEDKIECLQKILEINPENENAAKAMESAKLDRIRAFLTEAKAAIDKGRMDEAESILNEIVEDSPKVIDAWLLKAEAAQTSDEKITNFKKVLEIDPSNSLAMEGLAEQKVNLAKELVADAKNKIDKGHPGEAAKLVEQALRDAPNLHDAILLKSDLVEDLDEQASLLNRILVDDPKHKQALVRLEKVEQKTVVKLLAEAEDAVRNGDNPTAVDILNTVLKLDPESEEAWLMQSEVAESFEEKRSMLEKALAINPKNKKAQYAMNEIKVHFATRLMAKASKAAGKGDKPKAHRLIDEALVYDPELENAWLLKAYISDSFENKIRCFERVLELDPENAAAKTNLESLSLLVQTADSDEREDAEKSREESDSTASIDESDKIESPKNGNPNDEATISDDLDIEEESGDYQVNEPDKFGPIEMPNSNQDLIEVSSEMIGEFDIAEADDSLIEVSETIGDAAEQDSSNGLRSKIVLVVDDSPTIRRLISDKLEKSGYETVCAIDGMDAVNKINELTPDLVLLDIGMPKMDGFQVCKIIRENDATAEVPVIMVSSKDGMYEDDLGEEAGSTSFISKPFGPEALMKTVHEHLI